METFGFLLDISTRGDITQIYFGRWHYVEINTVIREYKKAHEHYRPSEFLHGETETFTFCHQIGEYPIDSLRQTMLAERLDILDWQIHSVAEGVADGTYKLSKVVRHYVERYGRRSHRVVQILIARIEDAIFASIRALPVPLLIELRENYKFSGEV
jgi:hypothetical protein